MSIVPLKIKDHLQKSRSDPKDSGGQGFKDSSEMLMNYKDLKVWQTGAKKERDLNI